MLIDIEVAMGRDARGTSLYSLMWYLACPTRLYNYPDSDVDLSLSCVGSVSRVVSVAHQRCAFCRTCPLVVFPPRM